MQTISKQPGHIRLGTYNVHNMVDGVQNPPTGPRSKPKKENIKPAKSMEAVASVLRDSEVDIVSLQEVENIEMLSALRDGHGLKEKFPYMLLVEGNDKVKGFDVAILSRYPIKRFDTHQDRTIGEVDGKVQKFRRDLLEADIELPNQQTLRVFSNHFISKKNGSTFCETIRQMEADETKEIVAEQYRKYPASYSVVMGDFNDTEESKVLQIFNEDGLVNVSEGLPNSWGEIWPTKYNPGRLDHIIADAILATRVRNRGVYHHPRDAWASDHRMVFVDVALPEARLAC